MAVAELRAARPVTPRHAAVAGVVAAALGLAVGEFVSGVTDRPSPVVAVGNKVIDKVPRSVKEFAIRTFGTGDKNALIVGILIVVTLYAAAVGLAARRNLAFGAAGAAVLGVVGAAAAISGRTGSLGDALPTVIAAAVAVAALTLLMVASRGSVRANPAGTEAVPGIPTTVVGRRQFLVMSGGAAGAAAVVGTVGRSMQTNTPANKIRQTVSLPPAADPLAPVAAGTTAAVPGMTPFLTPTSKFYRIDTALVIPRIDAKKWRLGITGAVDREIVLSYDDLLNRKLVEHDCTIMCVSNEIGGDLIGTARWLGVPLAEVLQEAGVRPEGTQVLGVSVDGFTAGFPTKLALDGRKALIAIGMNGEPLSFKHGFPARLIVPGIYGYVSAVKWLDSIQLTPFDEPDYDGYWIPRGWSKEAPIKTGSRIDVPRRNAKVPAGPVGVGGVAWAQHRGINTVEVQVDDEPWQTAKLAVDGGIDTWRQWSWRWEATPGKHRLRVRATDVDGRIQTEEEAPPAPDGATGWHTVQVKVDAAP